MRFDLGFAIQEKLRKELDELSKNDAFIDMPRKFSLDLSGQEAYNQFIDSEVKQMNQDSAEFLS